MKVVDRIKDHATEFSDAGQAMRLEDTLWWHVGRLAIFKNYLEAAKREVSSISRILEIGCGSGGSFGLLSEYGQVIGVESSDILAERARSRNIAHEVLMGDFYDVEIPIKPDITCLFDILEHIEDEDRFLKKLSYYARPGHLLLLSVPACRFLYSQHDVILHHYRRYSAKSLAEVLQKSCEELAKKWIRHPKEGLLRLFFVSYSGIVPAQRKGHGVARYPATHG